MVTQHPAIATGIRHEPGDAGSRRIHVSPGLCRSSMLLRKMRHDDRKRADAEAFHECRMLGVELACLIDDGGVSFLGMLRKLPDRIRWNLLCLFGRDRRLRA